MSRSLAYQFSCRLSCESKSPTRVSSAVLSTLMLSNSMGYSELTSQALSAPPYLVAFFVVIGTAYLSDRYRNRSTFVCFHALLGAFGYLIMAVAGWKEASPAWRYAGLFPAASGFFSAIAIIMTWTINNQESDSRKGMGMAMLSTIGQLGPLVGTRLYPDSDGPYYVRGMAVCAGFMVFVFVLSLGLRFVLASKNRGLGEGCSETRTGDHNGNGEDIGLLDKQEGETRKRRFEFIL